MKAIVAFILRHLLLLPSFSFLLFSLFFFEAPLDHLTAYFQACLVCSHAVHQDPLQNDQTGPALPWGDPPLLG